MIARNSWVAMGPSIVPWRLKLEVNYPGRWARVSTLVPRCSCRLSWRQANVRRFVWFLGQTEGREQARRLLNRYRGADVNALLHEVIRRWDDVLGAVQVRTPERAMDVLLNRWVLYQTLVCRVWARAAFYQLSGAYGFRDQLQDVMALSVRGARCHARASAAGRCAAVYRRVTFSIGGILHPGAVCGPASPTICSGCRTQSSSSLKSLAT